MAHSPRWKVYTERGEYIASVVHPIYGAMILAGLDNATIRDGHRKIVYTEGIDGSAAESYDNVVDICFTRAVIAKTTRKTQP